jgi:hypothetical protein
MRQVESGVDWAASRSGGGAGGLNRADRRYQYAVAAIVGATVTGVFFARPACNVRACGADYIQTWFLALAVGAVIGVVGMAPLLRRGQRPLHIGQSGVGEAGGGEAAPAQTTARRGVR